MLLIYTPIQRIRHGTFLAELLTSLVKQSPNTTPINILFQSLQDGQRRLESTVK